MAYPTNTETFTTVTLENVVAVIEAETPAPWIRELRDWYPAWEKVDLRLAVGG